MQAMLSQRMYSCIYVKAQAKLKFQLYLSETCLYPSHDELYGYYDSFCSFCYPAISGISHYPKGLCESPGEIRNFYCVTVNTEGSMYIQLILSNYVSMKL